MAQIFGARCSIGAEIGRSMHVGLSVLEAQLVRRSLRTCCARSSRKGLCRQGGSSRLCTRLGHTSRLRLAENRCLSKCSLVVRHREDTLWMNNDVRAEPHRKHLAQSREKSANKKKRGTYDEDHGARSSCSTSTRIMTRILARKCRSQTHKEDSETKKRTKHSQC